MSGGGRSTQIVALAETTAAIVSYIQGQGSSELWLFDESRRSHFSEHWRVSKLKVKVFSLPDSQTLRFYFLFEIHPEEGRYMPQTTQFDLFQAMFSFIKWAFKKLSIDVIGSIVNYLLNLILWKCSSLISQYYPDGIHWAFPPAVVQLFSNYCNIYFITLTLQNGQLPLIVALLGPKAGTTARSTWMFFEM